MYHFYPETEPRLHRYIEKHNKAVDQKLGYGNEGIVYSTHSQTAIKAFYRIEHYMRERDVYLRLEEDGVKSVCGFSVPDMVWHDDELWVIEMGVVSPPFVLDFAGAYLDEKPPFDQEQLEQWDQEKREQFEDRWPLVQSVMAEFRRHGIYLADVKPGNVMFGDEG